MVRSNPNRAGRFFAFENLNRVQREALWTQRNPDYEQRMEQMAKREIWPERGFDLTDVPNPRILQTAIDRGWVEFTKSSGPYDPALVREFYASMIPAVFNCYATVMVRGKPVKITAKDICDLYQVTEHPNLGASFGVASIPNVGDHETHNPHIASSLRRNRKPYWVQTTAEIRKSELPYDLAMWMLFIKSSLKPSRHTTYADPKVARVLYCIQHNLDLDIGQIIRLEMLDAAENRPRGILPFPSLITHFCQYALIGTGELFLPGPALGLYTYNLQVTYANIQDAKEALEEEEMQVPYGADDSEEEDSDFDPDEDTRANMDDGLRAWFGNQVTSLRKEMRTGFANLSLMMEELKEAQQANGGASSSARAPSTRATSTRRVRGRQTQLALPPTDG